MNNIRKTLLEGMKKKYGIPEYKEDSLQNISCGVEYKNLIKKALQYENSRFYKFGSDSRSNGLTAWVIPEQNGYVIISLHAITKEDGYGLEITDMVELGYLYIPNEEYNSIMGLQLAQEELARKELAKKEADFLIDL